MEQELTANGLGLWVLAAGFVVSVVGGVLGLVNGFRPQRRRVQMEGEVATLAQVERVAEDLADWKQQVVAKGEENRQEWKDDVNQLHARITGVEKCVSGLESETRLFNQALTRIDDKLDRFVTGRK